MAQINKKIPVCIFVDDHEKVARVLKFKNERSRNRYFNAVYNMPDHVEKVKGVYKNNTLCLTHDCQHCNDCCPAVRARDYHVMLADFDETKHMD